MSRRLLLLILPAVCFLLLATSLYLGRDHFRRLPFPNFFGTSAASSDNDSFSASTSAVDPSKPTATPGALNGKGFHVSNFNLRA